jgi:hypothetical protein
MKIWLEILVGVVLLIALYWILASILGFVIWAAMITLVVALVAALVRAWWGERQAKKGPNLKAERRTEKSAEKALKEMERRANTDRNRQ